MEAADQAMRWFTARRGGGYELKYHRSLSFGYRYEPPDGPAVFARVVGPEPYIRERVFHDYRLARYLYRHGVPVAEPMGFPRAVNGGFISQARYVELEDYNEFGPSIAASYAQIGESLAAIHQVDVSPNAQLPRHNVAQQFTRMLERITSVAPEVASAADLRLLSNRITQAEAQYRSAQLRTDELRIVHGDPNESNFPLRIEDGGVMPTDFEYGGVGIPAYDLAHHAWAPKRNPKYCSAERFDEMLSAYRRAGGNLHYEDIEPLIPMQDTFRALCCLARAERDVLDRQLWRERFSFYLQLFRGKDVGESEPG